MSKQLGVLCHVSSLPTEFGIGDFGQCSKDFIDFLSINNFSIWQILPLTDTNDMNSPYGSLCYFTFEEFFIDPLDLVKRNLITNDDLNELRKYSNGDKINYYPIRKEKNRLLKLAYQNITPELKDLILKELSKKESIKKYAYYKTLLEVFNTSDWRTINRNYFDSNTNEYQAFFNEHLDIILRYVFVQHLLSEEWQEILTYAKKKKIKILGDLPVYPEVNSFDVFDNPKLFLLDDNYNPLVYGGAPADGFSSKVQNWHTCIYNWDYLKDNNYSFLINKINVLLSHYNILRLDHFNGYVEHFEIDANDDNNTKWVTKGGSDFFNALKDQSNINNIIVEDLGIYKDEGRLIKEEFNLRGMAVLEFILDGEANHYLIPSKISHVPVYYLGTHDNLPFLGFLNSLDDSKKQELKNLLSIEGNTNEELHLNTIRQVLNGNSDIVIFQIQDLLMEDENYRMNDPSQSMGCWEYKAPINYNKKIASTLKKIFDN